MTSYRRGVLIFGSLPPCLSPPQHNLKKISKIFQKLFYPMDTSSDCCVICGEAHKLDRCDYIKISEHVLDNDIPSRAKLTLPSFLEHNILSDGTHSVTAKQTIDKGTKFGPFQAEKSQTLDPSNTFILRICPQEGEDGGGGYLNTSNEEKCNWLMFIQNADCVEEQNLICYQDDGDIYYVSIRNIENGEALKVWYAPYYARKMNKSLLASKNNSDTALKDIDINTLIKKQQKITERKTWTCKFCGQIESTIVTFARHILKHYTDQRSTRCQLCEKTFRSKNHLKSHLKIVHKVYFPSAQPKQARVSKMPTTASCRDVILGGPLLNDIFTDSSDLQQSELRSFDLTLDNQNLLLDNDDLIVDNLLNENVKDLDHFNFDIDDDQNQFVCDICLKQFTKARLLMLHLRFHTGDFTCYKCLKIFCRKENLKAHHCLSRSSHKCTLCEKKFQQKKHLSRHMDAVHMKKFSCASCGKCYFSNRDLIEHNCSQVPISDKEKFVCPVCDKTFYRRSYLRKHSKVHNSKLGVLCEICGLRLENSESLYKHVTIHGEPAFSCDSCDKKFYRSDMLREHVSTHGESQGVECNVCKKKFKNWKVLKSHVKNHGGGRAFKCSGCNLSFKHRSSLYRHLKDDRNKNVSKKNEKNEYYSCPVCDKSIKLRSSLLRHLRKMHLDVQLDLSAVRPKPRDAKNVQISNAGNKWDVQIDHLLENAENSTGFQKQAVDSLVEELVQDGGVEVSIPQAVPDNYQEITLDKNAYILDNGTIVQPQDDPNDVVIYVLEQTYQVE